MFLFRKSLPLLQDNHNYTYKLHHLVKTDDSFCKSYNHYLFYLFAAYVLFCRLTIYYIKILDSECGFLFTSTIHSFNFFFSLSIGFLRTLRKGHKTQEILGRLHLFKVSLSPYAISEELASIP